MDDCARLTQQSDLHNACRLLAGNISHYISNALATRLWDEFNTLGREGLVKLLMLSFSGVAIDME
jgi:hypothetical protein